MKLLGFRNFINLEQRKSGAQVRSRNVFEGGSLQMRRQKTPESLTLSENMKNRMNIILFFWSERDIKCK